MDNQPSFSDFRDKSSGFIFTADAIFLFLKTNVFRNMSKCTMLYNLQNEDNSKAQIGWDTKPLFTCLN